MKIKDIARDSMFLCLALILSYLESLVPLSIGVPGVKIGLPNLVIVFLFYKYGLKEAVLVSLLRVLLVSLLFGNVMTLAYSAAGAVLSLLAMVVMKKTDRFSEIGVSVAGGIFHNVGQIAVAVFVLETSGLLYYLPVLCISGVIAGAVIGVVSGILIKRVKIC